MDENEWESGQQPDEQQGDDGWVPDGWDLAEAPESPAVRSAEAHHPKKPASPRGTVLGAAMIGLGQVLEPQNVREPTVLVVAAPDDEPDVDLTFGDLPPLD